MFTRRDYKVILDAIRSHLISFHISGNGIILRHDVDDCLERSMAMARMEQGEGVKSIYFILDTAPYFHQEDPGFVTNMKELEILGHEVGWHNNALGNYYRSVGRITPLDAIQVPLRALRGMGLTIRVTSSHGDPICYEKNFINYNIFGFPSKGFEDYKGPYFKMEDFGLEIEAYHNKHTAYISDKKGQWPEDADDKILNFKEGRMQILIHPEWWDI